MATISRQANLLDRVDLLGLDVSRRIDAKRRAAMGQFFTPSQIARFMAELVEAPGKEVRLLDPGAGIGSLSAAWIARICEQEHRPQVVHLTAYEADAELAEYLRHTMELCAAACNEADVEFYSEVIEDDFIRSAVELVADRSLLNARQVGYDSAILNPPYCKLKSQSDARRALHSVGIETSNLYAAFLWLAFKLLVPNGELVAITPRSFCNGPYFRPFRKAFLREMTLTRFHVFESRNTAFKETEVLQENVIFRAVKNKQCRSAVISSSTSPDDPDICLREVSAEDLVCPRDQNLVIHVVPDEIGSRFVEIMKGFTATLHDLGIQVSTGRVVDFRVRDALAFNANGHAVPLIYPAHFDNGFISWPKQGKKPNYLTVDEGNKELLVSAATYVLVKRFSAKEEKKRIVAAVCDPARLPNQDYGFENHLNYFHCGGEGLSGLLAKGLAAYLNSTLVDSYFRLFSGHTQVNSADLRNLKYPDLSTLERIGRNIGNAFPNQDEIDALIMKETAMVKDDPIKLRKRIVQAQEIISVLGLPKAQQNERSALTLLALLDLMPKKKWSQASAPLRGITPIMDWFAEHYGKQYAPNTRETVRRQTIHQFVEAGIVLANPDDPTRPINSGKNVYQIEGSALTLLRAYGTKEWEKKLRAWLASVETLKVRYARERNMERIPLRLVSGEVVDLSPGGQNVLVKQIIEEFCPRFTPGGKPIYIGDTDSKWAYFNELALSGLGVKVDLHGKMPDVIIHHVKKKWLVLIEAVTSHGPVDGKRRDELKRLFQSSSAGLVFVTAFLNRAAMVKYLGDISWETEVWVADAPSHMIHFNGERFLGPYEN